GRAHAHEADHVQAEVTTRPDERGPLLRRAPATPGQAGEVELHEDPGPGRPAGDLACQRLPVDRLPQVDHARQLADLVRLQPADEVPADRELDARLGQLPALREQLLGVALAEVDAAGLER